ncbi:hypothetical protein EYC84_004419 [Monilinia fructicola]|uniref:Uncharacterized protein n=1 Tax=Monilinia fructicola TaxID=38448 RepID=A0A5M9K0A6_MONFR|nr:hypothetical protein EYC84_004419 [Monilinia fructicola]
MLNRQRRGSEDGEFGEICGRLFVTLGDVDGKGEDIRSSHALDFLADVWGEKGENEKADKALELLGDKYDKIRKNYWDWRRGLLGKKVRV